MVRRRRQSICYGKLTDIVKWELVVECASIRTYTHVSTASQSFQRRIESTAACMHISIQVCLSLNCPVMFYLVSVHLLSLYIYVQTWYTDFYTCCGHHDFLVTLQQQSSLWARQQSTHRIPALPTSCGPSLQHCKAAEQTQTAQQRLVSSQPPASITTTIHSLSARQQLLYNMPVLLTSRRLLLRRYKAAEATCIL